MPVADDAAVAANGEGEAEMLDDVDIASMDYPALSALRERIEEKVREMREVGGPALREKFAEEAAAIGMTIDEIVQTGAAGLPRTGRSPKAMAKMFRVYSVIQRPKQEDYWLSRMRMARASACCCRPFRCMETESW